MAAGTQATSSKIPDDAFVELGSAELTKDDILSFAAGAWLTDEAVAFATEKVQRLFTPAVRRLARVYHPS